MSTNARQHNPKAKLPLCGAKAHGTGAPCRRTAILGTNRCRYHGGLTPAPGPDHPNIRAGRRSKVFPREIMRGYLVAREDPDLLSMREELAALDGIIATREARLGSGASAAHLKGCRDYVRALRTAQHNQDTAAIGDILVALMEHIDRGGREEDAQTELIQLYKDRARLSEAEQRYLLAIGSMMSMEQALIMMRTWDDMMRRYITDPDQLRLFDREVQAILDGAPERIMHTKAAVR